MRPRARSNNPSFEGQHDHRNLTENLVVLDERAGLIAVEPRHHDINENDVGLMVRDLRERIKSIDRGEDLAAFVREGVSTVRQMVFLSSMTSTLGPEPGFGVSASVPRYPEKACCPLAREPSEPEPAGPITGCFNISGFTPGWLRRRSRSVGAPRQLKSHMSPRRVVLNPRSITITTTPISGCARRETMPPAPVRRRHGPDRADQARQRLDPRHAARRTGARLGAPLRGEERPMGARRPRTGRSCVPRSSSPGYEGWFTALGGASGSLPRWTCLLMRKDPPFDTEYLFDLHPGARAEEEGCLIANRPQGRRDMNEKVYTAWFPECCAPTLITRDREDRGAFLREGTARSSQTASGDGRQVDLRYGPGRQGCATRLRDAHRLRQAYAIVQRYLPDIVKTGDSRVLLVVGEPVPFALARIPSPDDNRRNLAAAQGVARPFNDRDRWLAETARTEAAKVGMLFVGLDVIGGFVTEINVTSPTGIREIDKAYHRHRRTADGRDRRAPRRPRASRRRVSLKRARASSPHSRWRSAAHATTAALPPAPVPEESESDPHRRAQRARRHPHRPLRRAAHLRRQRGRPLLRARLQHRPRPPVSSSTCGVARAAAS